MIRLLLAIFGITVLAVLALAIHADPHLWGSVLTAADHRAQHAGEDLNAHLNGWITPGPGGTP